MAIILNILKQNYQKISIYMEHLLNYKLSWFEHHGSPHLICIYWVLTSSGVHAKNWSMVKKYFKTAYLSQFLTYRYETSLFGIVTSRRFQRLVNRHTPIHCRDIEQNVKIVGIRSRGIKNGKITFTFCSMSLDWMGLERR